MAALDFSYARPGSAALNANGVTSVGRYLATDGRGITPTEFNDYISHGISVWFIKENAARGMLNGYGQGVADAQWAENQMNALGVSGAPIYFTADFDVQNSQFTALDAYLNGAASVIGLARVGIYAGLHYLNHAVNPRAVAAAAAELYARVAFAGQHADEAGTEAGVALPDG